MAFLPQFVDGTSTSKVGTFLFLEPCSCAPATAWCLILVWCASAMSRRFREKPSAGALLKRAAGADTLAEAGGYTITLTFFHAC
jgi:threonine/homoserine/homoserine lactone efflux protein